MALYKAGITAGSYYPHPSGQGNLHVVAADSNGVIRAVIVSKLGVHGKASIPESYLNLGPNVKAYAITSFEDVPTLVEEIAKLVNQGKEN